MKWNALALEGDEPTWTLPREATKGDRAHTVPPSPRAVTIIADLPRMAGEHVFNARGESLRHDEPIKQVFPQK